MQRSNNAAQIKEFLGKLLFSVVIYVFGRWITQVNSCRKRL
jgi:hypothetical protein